MRTNRWVEVFAVGRVDFVHKTTSKVLDLPAAIPSTKHDFSWPTLMAVPADRRRVNGPAKTQPAPVVARRELHAPGRTRAADELRKICAWWPVANELISSSQDGFDAFCCWLRISGEFAVANIATQHFSRTTCWTQAILRGAWSPTVAAFGCVLSSARAICPHQVRSVRYVAAERLRA